MPGAGRPKGSVGIVRRKIHDFFNEDDIKALVASAKAQAHEKPELLKFLLEQIFGKAPQAIEVSGHEGGPIIIQVAPEIATKNNLGVTNPITSPDSEGHA